MSYSLYTAPLLVTPPTLHDEVEVMIAQLAKDPLEHFKIDRGWLIKRSSWQRFCYYLKWNRKVDDANMSDFLHKIHQLFEEKVAFGPTWINSTKKFFYQVISKTALHLFDRRKISLKMQRILYPELGKLKNSKKDALSCKVAQAKLASALGVRPKKSNKGSTGPLVYVDLAGKQVAIFKGAKGKNLLWRLRQFFCQLVGFDTQDLYCRKKGTIPDYFSEIATSAADDFLKYGLIPSTGLVTLDHTLGSFMVWIHNNKMPSSYKVPRDGFKSHEITTFQRFTIEDFLIGNQDRHNENWLYQEKNGHIISISAIDNANAFIEKNPNAHTLRSRWATFWIRRQQYQWRNFPLAEIPFTSQVKLEMRSLTREKINRLIAYMQKCFPTTPEREAFFSPEMIAKLHERAHVLRKIGQQTRFTPRQMAALFSDQAIQEFLNKKTFIFSRGLNP